MKIEAGKYYRTREGRKVYVIDDDGSHHPFYVDHGREGKIWHLRDGRPNIFASRLDIIAEWTDAPDLTAITSPYGLLDDATREALKAHGGPYEVFTGKRWEKPRQNFLEDPDPAFVVRVKPQPPAPREWWAVFAHGLHVGMWDRLHLAESVAADYEGGIAEIIHVREVT